jgi:cytochrome c oxidase cbb3-type subunit 3
MNYTHIHKKYKIILALLMLSPASLFAEAPKVSELTNPMAQVLLGVVVALGICIVILANVVLSAAQVNLKKFKETEKNNQTNTGKIVSLIALMLLSTSLFAADGNAANATTVFDTVAGMQSSSFYGLIGTIIAELIIIFFLIANLKFLLKAETVTVKPIASSEIDVAKESNFQKWWDGFNSFRPIKEEAQIDLGHDYDGIRELDNRLPRWWLYGFYCCIIFAGIYLWRYHVSHTGMSSKEELQLAIEQGEMDKAEYLKNAANSVDETTVKYLNNEADIAAGKTIFLANCVACHGEAANGLINGNPGAGPNLTDDYWIHKGGMQDIFKTIKYGWPEKGMKSWKEDFSPIKIAQLASFIKSMHGKNATGKDPQGELYQDAANATTDTTKNIQNKIDSPKVNPISEVKK